MKTKLIILFAFLSTFAFSQSSGGGFTQFSKVRITTDPVSNPLRGKVLVRDSVTGNIDKILFSDLAKAIESEINAVTSVTGVADQITVANGTTTPVIGISSVFANSKANTSGGNSFTGIQNFANDIKLPVNSSVVLGDKFRWVYRSDLNGFSLTTEDVETGTIFIKDTDAKIGLHNTNPQSALDVVGSVRASINDGSATAVVRNQELEGYVPTSGTTESNPVTGDLEFDNGTSLKNIDDNSGNPITSKILFATSVNMSSSAESGESSGLYITQDNAQFESVDAEGNITTLAINPLGLGFSSSSVDSKGIVGNTIFNKQNDPNAYAQLGDSFLRYTTAEILALTPIAGDTYYNTTLNVVVYFDGTAWQQLAKIPM